MADCKVEKIDENTVSLAIENDMTIYHTVDLHAALVGLSSDEAIKKLVVNLEMVSEIDCSGIQNLVAFIEEAKLNNKEILITKISDVVNNVVHLINLTDDISACS